MDVDQLCQCLERHEDDLQVLKQGLCTEGTPGVVTVFQRLMDGLTPPQGMPHPAALERVRQEVRQLQELAWDQLHLGHWKDVPVVWRDLYALACLLSASAALHPPRPTHSTPGTISPLEHGAETTSQVLSVIKELDLGIMMGGPMFKDLLHEAVQHAELRVQAVQAAPGTMRPHGWAHGVHADGSMGVEGRPQDDGSTAIIAPGGSEAQLRPPAVAEAEMLGWAALRAMGGTDSDVVAGMEGRACKRTRTVGNVDGTGVPGLNDAGSGGGSGVDLHFGSSTPILAPGAGHIRAPALSSGAGTHKRSMTQAPTDHIIGAATVQRSACMMQARAPPVPGSCTPGHDAAVPLPAGSLEHGIVPGCRAVPTMHLPSLEQFAAECMMATPHGRPVIITGAMSGWPAMARWQDLQYLRRMAGHRTVPVEVGVHYLADGWGQRLMTLADFIDTHILKKQTPTEAPTLNDSAQADAGSTGQKQFSGGLEAAAPQAAGRAGLEQATSSTHPTAVDATLPSVSRQQAASSTRAAIDAQPNGDAVPGTCPDGPVAGEGPLGPSIAGQVDTGTTQRPAGYLAQHPLFTQIPALALDVREPEYCVLGRDEEEGGGVQAVNAWFGPAGTLTPLHTDPHHNLLCQVVGSKYVRLYSPDQSHAMYPYTEGLTTNSSQVDVMSVNQSRFPNFLSAPYQDCVLGPGEMLYIPPGWWHLVIARTVSFSVSYWWC